MNHTRRERRLLARCLIVSLHTDVCITQDSCVVILMTLGGVCLCVCLCVGPMAISDENTSVADWYVCCIVFICGLFVYLSGLLSFLFT